MPRDRKPVPGRISRPKVRRFWKIHPRTRVKPSGKRYRRSEMKRRMRLRIKVEEDLDLL